MLEQNFLSLALPAETFDGIFANASLFHVPTGALPRVLGELRDALKPGGELLVIDHVAQAGSQVRDTDTLHRIDPDVIIRSAQTAGFRLEAHSDLLRNPRDTHQLRVFGDFVKGFRIAAQRDHTRGGFSKFHGDRMANTGGRSGNEYNFVCKTSFHQQFLSDL